MNTPINKSIFNETGCIRREQLLRYRDKQLTGPEQHEVEEHLVDCLLCSEALEGFALVNNTGAIDAVQQEVSRLVSPTPLQTLRPWLAAAAISGMVLFSVFTYMQYKNVNDHRLAASEETATENVIPQVADENVVTAPGTQTTVEPAPSISNTERSKVISKKEVQPSVPVVENNRLADFSEVDASQEPATPATGTSYSMSVPPAVAKDIAPVSTAAKNTGNQNITYVDNVKVIDYNDYNAGNVQQADVPRGTTSKYQNNKVQAAESATTEEKTAARKKEEDYLDLVADPVILFNNGRYESANAGFDKLLRKNSNDQNAAFYKGLSLYNMQQYDPALKLLVPISNDSASPFMEEAKFYAAQSFISNGQVPKGKMILEEISNSNGFYSKKAQEELIKIR